MSELTNLPNFTTNPEHRARLLELLKEKSYVEGEVILASGKKSDFYIDCRQSSLDAEGAYLVGQIFYHWLEQLEKKPVAVGGMTMGADPLVTATSITSFLEGDPIPGFLIRKEPKGHGLKKWIEGRGKLQDNDMVWLLEDVVTTGGSTIKALDACEAEGLKVGGVFCMVDRLEGGRDALVPRGIQLVSIFTRKDFKP